MEKEERICNKQSMLQKKTNENTANNQLRKFIHVLNHLILQRFANIFNWDGFSRKITLQKIGRKGDENSKLQQSTEDEDERKYNKQSKEEEE